MNWLHLAEAQGIEGKMHPAELAKLVELAEGREVLEIGSYAGLSAWCMSHSAKSVHCIDTFKAVTNGQDQGPEFTTLEWFKRAISSRNNVTYEIGTSEEAFRRNERKFDMIFLDAMHTEEHVFWDAKHWWTCLREGGVFALHDYTHLDYPGVTLAADEIFGPAKPEEVEITLRWIRKPGP